jgi:hypothetical protein
MTHQDQPARQPTGGARRIWLKFALAIGLSALAVLAGTFGIGPWPESGFVSGLILLATGPFFALRLSASHLREKNPTQAGGAWDNLPWLTSAIGLAEMAVVLATAISKR